MNIELTEQETRVIQARICGRGINQIAKAEGITIREVRRIVDLFADNTFDPTIRKTHLALQLARLDGIMETFYPKMLAGELPATQVILRSIERQCVILGLHTPQQHTLQIVDATDRKMTSTDRIEHALNALLTDQRARQNGSSNSKEHETTN